MSLSKRAITGVKWNLISTLTVTSTNMVLMWYLSHLFTSNEYGIIASAMVIVSFSSMLLDFGISNSIIRSESVETDELSSLFIINLMIGLVGFLLVFTFSYYIAQLFNGGFELQTQIKIISFAFLFSSFGLQSKALLNREMAFDVISKITIISMVFNFVLVCTLSYLFKAVWCVALSFVATSLLTSLLLNFHKNKLIPHDAGWAFKLKKIKKHLTYGSQLVTDSFVNQISINTYPVLMSKLVSLSAIGGYNISYSISIGLFERLNPVLSHSLFPAFSKISKDSERLKSNFLKVTSFSSIINFPMLIGMYLTCSYVIEIFFEQKWFFIIPIVKILCCVGLVRSLDVPIISILLVKGQMYKNVYLGIFKLFIGIPLAWYLGELYGVTGIAFSFLVIQILNSTIGFFALIKSTIDIKITEYVSSILIPLCLSFPMILIIKFMEHILKFYDASNLCSFVVLVFTGVVTFSITVLLAPFTLAKDFKKTVLNNI